MVSTNNKLIVFVLMIDFLLVGFISILPNEISSNITGTTSNTIIYNSTNTTLSGWSDVELNGWDAIWIFIVFLFSLGTIGIGGMPSFLSIPLSAFLVILNILMIMELVSWVRELLQI